MGTTFSKTFFEVMRSTMLDRSASKTSFTRLGIFGMRKKGDMLLTPISNVHVKVAVVFASRARFMGWSEASEGDVRRIPKFDIQPDEMTVQRIFSSLDQSRTVETGEVRWETQVLLAHLRIEDLMHMVLEIWQYEAQIAAQNTNGNTNESGYPKTRREALMLAANELAKTALPLLMAGIDAIIADNSLNAVLCDFRPEMKPVPPLPDTYPKDFMSVISGN